MHHGVIFNGRIKACKFLFVWQLAVEQQIAHFKVGAFFCQLINRVAPMQQNTFFTIDKRDATFAASCRAKARIVGEVARLFVKTLHVNTTGPMGALQHVEIGTFASSVVGQSDCFISHLVMIFFAGGTFRGSGFRAVRGLNLLTFTL